MVRLCVVAVEGRRCGGGVAAVCGSGAVLFRCGRRAVAVVLRWCCGGGAVVVRWVVRVRCRIISYLHVGVWGGGRR